MSKHSRMNDQLAMWLDWKQRNTFVSFCTQAACGKDCTEPAWFKQR